MNDPGPTICPACNSGIHGIMKNGKNRVGATQHHFALGHDVEVMRSHELARKFWNGGLSDEEIDEIRQMSLRF